MKIQIKDEVGLNEKICLQLATSLIENRQPKEGSFDYGLETFGVFGIPNFTLDYPIQVSQTNKRKTGKSPIVITIKRHYPII
jgi:hypothetical protein